MKAGKVVGALLGAVALACSLAPSALAGPAPSPAWEIQSLATPTNFVPGDESVSATYTAFVTNGGGKATDRSPVTITDTLPAGLEVSSVEFGAPRTAFELSIGKKACETTIDVDSEVSTVSCEVTDSIRPETEPTRFEPGDVALLQIVVKVPPSATGTLVNRVAVKGGGADPVVAEAENKASAEDAPAGFEEFHSALTGVDGKPATGAASHPYQYTTSFAVNVVPTPPGSATPFLPAEGDLKEIEVALPPGLAGNPTAIPRCTAQQLLRIVGAEECPIGSVVGVAKVRQLEGQGGFGFRIPLYNMVPPKGMPAQLAFRVLGAPIYINTRVRSGGDYGITSYLHNITEAKRITASQITVWGTPWDASHDPMRGACVESFGLCPVEDPAAARPFWRLPSSCASAMSSTMGFSTWTRPPIFASAGDTQPAPSECDKPPFDPTVESKPTTSVADAPSGLHFKLHFPQAENEDPEGLGEADLRSTRVTLPAGLSVNPSSADGLAACSLSQIGYTGQFEGHPSFSADPPNCPDASKIGSVELDVPAVDHPLPGAVYLASPHANPFNSLIALYITAADPQSGVVVKLPAEVKPDPNTGQLTTVVAQSPQQPFEDFKLDFFEGARAPLRTPALCGTHTTTTSLTPWSAPASGPDATPADSFATSKAPDGGACATSAAQLPNKPGFEAGSASPIAGAYSPFLIHLSRQDGSQELKGLNLSLPAGMAAKFAGVAECSDGAIAAAQAKSGAQEQASASCPSSSQLGTVTVAAGAGPAPFYTHGKIYLAGPYQGAPLSTAIITPAVAGPFDLGDVVVRAPLYVDPETARATVKSTFPTILQGIPLDLRSIDVSIDRSQFTLNPTSCEEKAVAGETISVTGQSAPLNNRFQVGGCANLGFKPGLSLKLIGGTKRGAHPSLRATVTYPKAGAYSNIAYAQVALPHSEFLDQGHIGTVCTRVQFAVQACPAKSVYGYAKAITPLFDQPLEGPVYLRSSNNQLPDLVAALNGQVNVVLAGKNDSIHGGLRNTFEAVPDAPVSKFTLTLKGAKKGLLQNSTDICVGTHKANARFVAQNGKVVVLQPELKAQCPKAKAKHGKRRRG